MQKPLNLISFTPQLKVKTVARVADDFIGPTQNDITQCRKGLLETLNRPGLTRPTVKQSVSHKNSIVTLNGKADLILCMAGCVVDTQYVMPHGQGVAML